MAVLISINQKGRVGKFLSSNRGMVHMGRRLLERS